MDLEEKAAPPFWDRMRKSLRRRWVQVVLILVVGAVASVISWFAFSPRQDLKADRESGKLKFIHCNQCRTELPYNPDLDGKRCAKCQPPKTGFYVPTTETIKGFAGAASPYKWAYLSVVFELFACLAAIVYILYLPYSDPSKTYYVFRCPHCGQRLRFRHTSLDGLGQCSRCKRPVRFPSEDDAVKEDDLIKEEQERLLAQEEDEADEEEAQ